MSNIYEVVIRATVTKTIQVTAEDEAEALEIAHAEFTTECDGDEDYTEDTIRIDCIGEIENTED